MYTRLTRAEIEGIIKNSKVVHTPYFSVRVLYNNEVTSKGAFVVSKKNFKTAVIRNKAKRRSREAFREVSGKIKNSYSVFFLKKNILDISVKDLGEEILKVLG